MDYLVFQLQAPLAAWGEPAVGEYRGSAAHPGESALLGLLAAPLPAPEPVTLSLFGAGVAGAIVLRRRKKA